MKWVLTGEDRSASSTLGKAATAGEDATSKIGGAFQKLGSQIGGPFGAVLDKLGAGLEQSGEKGLSLGKKFAIGGAAIAGAGALLTAAGSKEKQATDQLKASVDSTGESYSEYADKIEKVVKREENFAHSAEDTKNALRVLTDATGSEQKALDNMQVVTDLAASKHISLAEAATLLAKILEGKGGKTLLQYGIIMKTNADGTKDVAGAVDELGQKLKGQASASMDNWGAKVEAAKTKVQDFIGEVGQKVGPALTVAGTVIGVVSGGIDILAARAERAAAKELVLAAAEEKTAASSAAAAAGSAEVAAGNEAVAATSTGAATGLAGLAAAAARVAGPIAAVVAAGVALQVASDKFQGHTFMHDVLDPHNADVLKVQSSGMDALRTAYWSAHDGISGTAAQLLNWGSIEANATVVTKQHYVSQKEYNKTLDELRGSLGPASGATTTLGTAAKVTSKEETDLADKMNKVKTSALSETAQLGYLGTALDKLSNNAITAEQQELSLKDAMANLVTQAKANGHSLDENTAKGRSNKEGLLSLINGINDHAVSVGKQTGSVAKATTALKTDEAALRTSMTQAGYTKKQIDDLIHSYAATPKKVATLVEAQLAKARAELRDYKYQLDRLNGRVVSIDIYQTMHQVGPAAGGHLAPLHASGGYLSEGWNTAGEGSATELMYKSGSQVQVLTNQQSKPMLGGGGNVYVTINAGFGTDPVAVRRALIQALADAASSGQTIPILKALR
jgi:hypothetical protein